MRRAFVVLFLCAHGFAQSQPCKSHISGALEVVPLASKVFNNTRNLRIWLPPDYSKPANSSRRYPVLYMMDGQTLFDSCAANYPEWQIDEHLTRMIGSGVLPPLIVIGIDFAGDKRAFEFLPWRDSVFEPTQPEPGGKRFPEFLADEVVPFVASHYRIEKGPQGIGGSSFGAVAALYALIVRPDLFHLGLIESPSLAVGNGQMLRETQHLYKGPTRVFIGAGTVEDSPDPNSSENLGYLYTIHVLEANLKGIAVNPSRVLTVIQPGAKHHSSAWSARFPQAMEFLYPLR